MVTYRRSAVDEVLALERELQSAKFRRTPSRIESLLADDFTEIGASGTAWDKPAMMSMLADESDAVIEMSELHGRALGDDVVLTRWISTRERTRARRSSVWFRGSSGWQLTHHQGTPLH